MRFSRAALATLLTLIFALATAAPASAMVKHHRRAHRAPVASASTGVNDPRYADLVMDPVTGEVLHQDSPDARRHPASLTKMMTLYLLFDALQKGRITMDDRMPVSALAASQPQTNIALDQGDSVPVETAIKAIVVRSANDVAVVVAEALGGTEDHFADMMNAKAKALGMTKTHFENANGLPNDNQYTTARDMAKLGIALKRDFPQYYPYFSTREFSWQGVSYYTHNRVMLRYAGVDGIKTGYIGNSGFNLVTSVTRGGRPLVGVVMGGTTGAWRDNRMIELLNQSYVQLASRGNARAPVIAANLPAGKDTALPAPSAGVGNDKDEAAAEADSDREEVASVAPTVPVAAMPAPATAAIPAPLSPPAAPVPPTAAIAKPLPPAAPAKPVAPQMTASVAPAAKTPVTAPSTLPSGRPALSVAPPASGWGIQVGAFSTPIQAKQATDRAMQLSPGLKGSRIIMDEGNKVHRARLENLSENQARKACETLISNNSPCFIYKSGTKNL